ncbi:calmodulin-regulated spectrin-associated protein 1 [Lates japonicus]|uniref:Calmodulin-regulated spectrin-associated protein 1 n=1 Tax=Lates japonicus TaxID=270547 RepID=A0AAD3NEP1_LATJO|nr:calmodulin-regulated spectrin-associated protein 1 [Lates japonicus]
MLMKQNVQFPLVQLLSPGDENSDSKAGASFHYVEHLTGLARHRNPKLSSGGLRSRLIRAKNSKEPKAAGPQDHTHPECVRGVTTSRQLAGAGPQGRAA